MNSSLNYVYYPLGDSAITIDFGNKMDETINRYVIALFHHLQKNSPEGVTEAVPAYSSLTVYYNPIYASKQSDKKTAFEWMRLQLDNILKKNTITGEFTYREMKIPVCYEKEFAPDLETLAAAKKLTPEEVIRIHSAKKYRVYMLGFLPGFAYMGEVDETIATPRLKQPRQLVTAGSVGIAGKQTGIYPLDSPGGWQIIGRTPLKLFNVSSSSPAGTSGNPISLLEPGDEVQFYMITKNEFEDFQSRHT